MKLVIEKIVLDLENLKLMGKEPSLDDIIGIVQNYSYEERLNILNAHVHASENIADRGNTWNDFEAEKYLSETFK